MKVGYKKSRKKTSKRARQAAADIEGGAGVNGPVAMEVEDVDADAQLQESKKARKRRQLLEKKTLKAKTALIKKTKMTVRKGMARGLQGATNQTHNQLSQHIMKLAQEHEGQGVQAGKKEKRKGGPDAVSSMDVEMAA